MFATWFATQFVTELARLGRVYEIVSLESGLMRPKADGTRAETP